MAPATDDRRSAAMTSLVGPEVVHARPRGDFIVPRPSELHPSLQRRKRTRDQAVLVSIGPQATARRSAEPAGGLRPAIDVSAILDRIPHPRMAIAVIMIAGALGIAVAILARG
jgi:hypothetical protein